ncbi:MAG: efflux RND transporter periplasmic adaptor subunit [Peptococcia bacterium]|jgi:RND family efflux transporter MFP subunit
MTKKGLILVLAMFIILSVVSVGCQSQEEQKVVDSQVKKIPVTVENVHKGTLEKKIPLGGLLKAQEEVFIVAKSPVFKIVDVLVEVGDYVTKGTPLVIFDSRELDLQLEQAELAYERNLELYEIGAVSKFQLEQSETALENLQLQKENCSLLSTINGVVASVSAIEGQLAGSAPLVSIVDIDYLELEIQVGEAYISKLNKGARVEVSVPAVAKEDFKGVIITIPPQIDSRTKAYPVTLSLPNKKGLLKDGMYGEVRLVTERKENILVIPQYAVVEFEQKQVVFVVESDIAKMREVELGLTLGDRAEVVKGLHEGEMLIVEGQYGVKDGSPVAPLTRGENK